MENIYADTLSFIKNKNRIYVEGKLTNEPKTIVSVYEKSEFWKLFENTPNAVIVVDKRINKISSDDLIDINESLLERFAEEIERIKSNRTKIHSIKLYFCIDNFILKFKYEADWIGEYKLVKSLINDPEFMEELLEESEIDSKKGLSNEEKKEIITETLKDERFNTYLTPVQLSQLIVLIFDEKNYTGWEYNNLKYVIEARYNNNIKPEHEKQLKTKIQELKKTKISKTAICSELNIGMTLLNKYF